MIDFLKGTVGKDYFSSAWVGWELIGTMDKGAPIHTMLLVIYWILPEKITNKLM